MANEKFYNAVKQVSSEISELLAQKNEAYGDSFHSTGKVMAILYPDGIPANKVKDALIIVRILDKITRIAKGNKAAFGESPYRDICGYSTLELADEFLEEQSDKQNTYNQQ